MCLAMFTASYLTAAFWRVFASRPRRLLGDSSCFCGVIGLVLNRDGYESGDYGGFDFALTMSVYDNQTSSIWSPSPTASFQRSTKARLSARRAAVVTAAPSRLVAATVPRRSKPYISTLPPRRTTWSGACRVYKLRGFCA
jgi:hypothetical protein